MNDRKLSILRLRRDFYNEKGLTKKIKELEEKVENDKNVETMCKKKRR